MIIVESDGAGARPHPVMGVSTAGVAGSAGAPPVSVEVGERAAVADYPGRDPVAATAGPTAARVDRHPVADGEPVPGRRSPAT